MISKSMFRVLVISILIVTFGSIFVDNFINNPVASNVLTYSENVNKIKQPIFFGMMSIISITIMLIGSVGLLLFKKWGRILYILSWVFYFALYSGTQVFVLTPISSFLSDIGSLGEGFILALAYFSPISEYFNKQVA